MFGKNLAKLPANLSLFGLEVSVKYCAFCPFFFPQTTQIFLFATHNRTTCAPVSFRHSTSFPAIRTTRRNGVTGSTTSQKGNAYGGFRRESVLASVCLHSPPSYLPGGVCRGTSCFVQLCAFFGIFSLIFVRGFSYQPPGVGQCVWSLSLRIYLSLFVSDHPKKKGHLYFLPMRLVTTMSWHKKKYLKIPSSVGDFHHRGRCSRSWARTTAVQCLASSPVHSNTAGHFVSIFPNDILPHICRASLNINVKTSAAPAACFKGDRPPPSSSPP